MRETPLQPFHDTSGMPEPGPPPVGQATTTVTQTGTLAQPAPWLSRQLTNFLAIVVTISVVYLAYKGDTQAQAALISGFSMLTGMILGSRLALKIPGKDT